MAIPTAEFWKLLAESRLINPARLPQLQTGFAGIKGAATADNTRTLAEWLVAEKAITRYQAKVLLAGRSGPFFYGDYCLTEKCDTGRLAGRFRAMHAPSGHPVILEFLSGPLTKSRELWLAAAQTAERARSIIMPGYCRLYELQDLTAFKFAVMEDVRGDTLDKYLSGGAALPPEEACRIARLVALTLSQMHQMGQPYGEIRPENILLTPEGGVKLLCPPLAHDLTKSPGSFIWGQEDPTGRLFRAADYMAPELAPAGARPSAGTDIYALGCLMYRMLSGQEPFAGGTVVEKVQRHATQAIVPLQSYGLPDQLAQVVTYMMAKNPSVRFQNANQLVDGLSPFVPENRRNPPRIAASSTLDSFEQTLQQRRAALFQKAQQVEIIPNLQTSLVRGPLNTSSSAVAAVGSPGGTDSLTNRLGGRRKKSNAGLWIGIAVGVIGVATAVGLMKFLPSAEPDVTQVDPGEKSKPFNDDESKDVSSYKLKTAGGETIPAAPVQVMREQAIPDDRRSLWVSPTGGPPISLKYLPPGAQVFLAIRPAELLAGEQGEKIMAALGPLGASYLQRLEEVTAFKGSEMEQVVIGIESSKTGVVDASLVVYLKDAMPRAALIKVWGDPAESKEDGQSYYLARGRAYYIPEDESSRTFAITTPEAIKELINFKGATPPMRREMEEMLEDTYAARHMTLLFAPNYLFGDGKLGLFAGAAAPLQKPLFEFFGSDQIKSGVFSLHAGENFFAELRLGGQLDLPPADLASQIGTRLNELPQHFRRLLLELSPPEYAADLMADFPEYIRLLSSYTRSGTEHDQAVLRSYLPAGAGQYLLLGSELTLALLGGGGGGTPSTGPTVAAEPTTVAEKLQKKVSLSFPRDTLEISIQLLAKELGVEIEIIGPDLQLDGITKNQSFGIDLRDQPGKKILEQILLLSNPDKTATGPGDVKQKLVYVVKPKVAGGPEMVFVTTRAQVEKRGDKLPPEFQVK